MLIAHFVQINWLFADDENDQSLRCNRHVSGLTSLYVKLATFQSAVYNNVLKDVGCIGASTIFLYAGFRKIPRAGR
jgi:hypothetical protein